jgi:hypothetical protein
METICPQDCHRAGLTTANASFSAHREWGVLSFSTVVEKLWVNLFFLPIVPVGRGIPNTILAPASPNHNPLAH